MPEGEFVWEGVLDGRYRVTVERTAPYQGLLRIEDMTDGTTLHSEDVALGYGAVFGPDVGDVATWQQRVVEVVEGNSSDDLEPG